MFLNRFSLIGIILFITQFGVFAQEWGKGQIISLGNDTLTGLVATGIGEEMHEVCYFKPDLQSGTQVLEIKTIQSLAFEKGQVFESKEVKTNKRSGFYLVESLLKGIINLYYLNSIDSVKYQKTENKLKIDNTTKKVGIYIAEMTSKKNKMVELISPETSNSSSITKKRNDRTLLLIFDDHPDMIRAIAKANYTRNDLIQLFKKYHDLICKDYECIIYSQKKANHRLSISPYLCFDLNQLQFYELNFNTGSRWQYINKFQAAMQVTSSYNIIPFSEKMQLNIGVRLAKVNFEKISFPEPISLSGTYQKYFYSVSGYQIMPTLSISYIFFKYKIKPIIELGTYASFLVDQNNASVSLYLDKYVTENKFTYDSPIGGIFVATGTNIKIHNKHIIPIRFTYSFSPIDFRLTNEHGAFGYSFFTFKAGYTFIL